MNKELLDKVTQALNAQQRAIEIHEQTIRQKEQDIAHLKALLEKLTATQIQQLQSLPTLYENLKNTINEQRKTYSDWKKERKLLVELMDKLVKDSIALSNIQNQLIESMKSYQSTIIPPDSLQSDTEKLESELDKLASSQTKIINRQNSLSEQQQNLLKLLQE